MARVLLRSTRRAGGTKSVAPRLAEALVRRGGWEYVDAAVPVPAPPPAATPAAPAAAKKRRTVKPAHEPSARAAAPDYDAMSYNELRALAAERELGLSRPTKEDLVAALRKGRYQRRDMRAE